MVVNKREQKFWIGVASQEHVERGKAWGICQFCHGKPGPAKRVARGDYVIYYSSKKMMEGNELYQKFTAIGVVTDDQPYQVEMAPGFAPFRRNVAYLPSQDLAIRPLIARLPFIVNKARWGYAFRFGFFEIDRESFAVIAEGMLGYNPLNQTVS